MRSEVWAALALAVSGCGDGVGITAEPLQGTSVRCDADNGGISLPAGFCAVVVADHVGVARHMAVSQSGNLYVALDGTGAGGVLALRDRDRDGRADVMVPFGAPGANGVTLTKEFLYVSYRDRIVRYALEPGELVPAGAPETIVGDLPFAGDHFRKNTQLDGAGSMFVNIGSASNSCQVMNRALESPGVDPCPELPVRAGIWRFDASRAGQTQADGEHFATGFRNVEALRWDRGRGALFGLQHGRDMLNDNWPALYTTQQGADLPSEELARIDRGDDNGWPYCYHDWQQGLKVLAPEYGGDGHVVGRCAGKEQPLLTFPGHWAPNDLLFYGGKQFPVRFQGGASGSFQEEAAAFRRSR